jgi:hypothetical protein
MFIMFKTCYSKGKDKMFFWGRIKEVNFTLVQATKAQRVSTCIALLFM